MAAHSPHPSRQPPQHQHLLSDCRDIIQLLYELLGSNTSMREAAQSSPRHKNCVDLLMSVKDATKNHDVVADTADLDVPDNGMALYAFATPFILIIGTVTTRLYFIVS